MAYVVIATYTAEDGLEDLDQRGPFENLSSAVEVFDCYIGCEEYRDVQLWEVGGARVK